MRYSSVQNALVKLLQTNPRQTVFISGPPGVGKSAMVHGAARVLAIPPDNVQVLHLSRMEPTDLMGLPYLEGETTAYKPPAWLAKLATGRHLLFLDEFADISNKTMFGAVGGLILDRVMSGVTLSPEVYIVCAGNRTEDKASANRIPSQIANRMCHFSVEVNAEDTLNHFLDIGLDLKLIAFLRLRPALLHDFSPDRMSNPTPRSWEMVARSTDPAHMAKDEMFQIAAGLVGDGAASEYVGIRDLMDKMPDIKDIIRRPTEAAAPKEPAVMFAVATALGQAVDSKNFDAVLQYTARMPREFDVLFMKDAVRRDKKLTSCKPFIAWAEKHQNVFV